MKLKIIQKIYLFFLLLINTQFSQAHNTSNGGCNNHCQEIIPITIENDLNNNNDKNQTQDNYSCLNTSLCRG